MAHSLKIFFKDTCYGVQEDSFFVFDPINNFTPTTKYCIVMINITINLVAGQPAVQIFKNNICKYFSFFEIL